MALERDTRVLWNGNAYLVGDEEKSKRRFYAAPRGEVRCYDLMDPSGNGQVIWHDIEEDTMTVIEEPST